MSTESISVAGGSYETPTRESHTMINALRSNLGRFILAHRRLIAISLFAISVPPIGIVLLESHIPTSIPTSPSHNFDLPEPANNPTAPKGGGKIEGSVPLPRDIDSSIYPLTTSVGNGGFVGDIGGSSIKLTPTPTP